MTLSFLTPAQHRRLIAKAWRDERFKQELMQNPKAVIEREFNIKLPDDLEIQVVEEGEEGEDGVTTEG